jgi:hypothetical protein
VSVILDIYDELATNCDVTVSAITPTVYGLTALPDEVNDAMLPCRLLLPMQPRGEGRDWHFVALGQMTKLTWHITDLMLWRRADAGIGLEDIASVLVDYAGQYAEMLRRHRSLGQAQAHIISARFVYGTFRYPDVEGDAGVDFDGCAVELDIEEVLSG